MVSVSKMICYDAVVYEQTRLQVYVIDIVQYTSTQTYFDYNLIGEPTAKSNKLEIQNSVIRAPVECFWLCCVALL
jgi:hypothetical protein